MKAYLSIAILFLLIGIVMGDYIAYRFAKARKVHKYGGLFSLTPKAGPKTNVPITPSLN